MDTLTITIDRHGYIVIIRLRGELDMVTAPSLRDCLTLALIEFESPMVVIDAAELTFCDSSGLSALLSGTSLTEAAGGSLVLSAVNGHLRRLLHLTGLSERFQIFPTVQEAVAHLG
ncbi:STAS domain-containing protein [Nonomuraea soli]|uniref:Anti-sigma factor antagonist n=1 Tax=Nonomuraea soli TaxID=1032476 RepID=A0A7W0CGD4_9ACTN|nr:STAS domain-containing protein [Nonomuraea soli]MBA2890712.1 anti-anti-sigma factor [Nonomuraea soli]